MVKIIKFSISKLICILLMHYNVSTDTFVSSCAAVHSLMYHIDYHMFTFLDTRVEFSPVIGNIYHLYPKPGREFLYWDSITIIQQTMEELVQKT